MKDYGAGHFPAALVIAVGVLICFWGYRILKITLGIVGFVAGASAGWETGAALVPGDGGVAFLRAIVGGVIGAILCKRNKRLT